VTTRTGVAPAWKRLVRPRDIIWIVLFAALAWGGPVRSGAERPLLACLAALQIAEQHILALSTVKGSLLSISVKIFVTYVLMGYSGGINSSYYPLLILPVVSAATTLGAIGTVAFTTLACAAYLSFLLFLDWSRWEIPPEEVRELFLRGSFLPIAGFLTYQLAEANRVAARKYQAVAEQLAVANRNLREAEEAFRRSERLAALGQMTAGLAHELRNPLGTIRASAEMLTKKVAQGDAVASELAGFISSEVDRTNSLVTRFLDFARPLKLRRAPTNLNEVIDRALAELERRQPPIQVTMYRNYSPEIPPFLFDRELMQLVLFNLVLNAAQATPPGGAVTVKTRLLGEDVEIAVIDRGEGIERKHFESIFNPFFTTKPDGVGLGLAIVSKIVDEHGGKIVIESEPSKGSVFRVFLPFDRSEPS
jgi:two-component system, NtrC family, sensor histidine kinase HydH